jgi:4-hydroxy-4-methyl-2-oxoglutarate aldolase
VGARSNVLEPHVRPLAPNSAVAGFAATVHIVPVSGPPADPADYYRNELAAVDALEPGDVMVVSTCHLSYWGELLSTAALRRGAHGIVADAYTRDMNAILELGFPTFVAGVQAQDSLGRVDVDVFGEPITCGGVRVVQGDLVLGGPDGVVVIPQEHAEHVLSLAERKIALEDEMRADLSAGMSIGEAFRSYGIL